MLDYRETSVRGFAPVCPSPSRRRRCSLPIACLVRAVRRSESCPRHRPRTVLPPSPFRHFLPSPCAVDKETRTPPRLSFSQAPVKMADIQVRVRSGKRYPAPSLGVNSEHPRFPGDSFGRQRVFLRFSIVFLYSYKCMGWVVFWRPWALRVIYAE